MHSKKIKYRIAAIIGYALPFVLAAFVALFTKWGDKEENCIFAFFVGVVIEFIIGICGLIRLRGQEGRKKERILFWGNLLLMVLMALLLSLSTCYRMDDTDSKKSAGIASPIPVSAFGRISVGKNTGSGIW